MKNPVLYFGVLCALAMGCMQEPAEAPVPIQPIQLSLEGGHAPTTAINPTSGAIYVAWLAESDHGTEVYFAQRAPGGEALSPPVRVNHIAGDATLHAQAPAQVVVGPEGQIYIAWTTHVPAEGRIFAASDLRFARSTDGGRTFSDAITVNSDAGGIPSSHTFHDIAVGPDGTIYVAWLDGRLRDAARTRLMAAGKMGPVHLDPDDPHAKMNAIKAEAQADLPGTQLWVSTSSDGGQTFSEGHAVADTTCNCCRVSIEAAADGSVYLAWRHIFEGGERDIALVRSTDGAHTFTEPVRVFNDAWQINGCPHTGPSLAIDQGGRVHIAWYTGVQTHPGLYYAMSDDDGQAFTQPVVLSEKVPVSQVKMGGTGQEDVWVAWEEKGQIRTAHARGDGSLDFTPEPAVAGTYPAVAVAGRYWVLAHQGDPVSQLQILPVALD